MPTRAELANANLGLLDTEISNATTAGKTDLTTAHGARATALGVRALALILLDTNDLLRELIAQGKGPGEDSPVSGQ
jgi:hypothetical protein